jgi:hypothetical protein
MAEELQAKKYFQQAAIFASCVLKVYYHNGIYMLFQPILLYVVPVGRGKGRYSPFRLKISLIHLKISLIRHVVITEYWKLNILSL